MSARSGMSELITELRGLTHTSSADYTLGVEAYWSDEHLQAALDRHRTQVVYDLLEHDDEYSAGGALNVTRYRSNFGDFESGTTVFSVLDATYNLVGTALYTPDYKRGEIVFAANTGGSTYYLSGRAYDLNRAAADVWRMKAAHAAARVDFSSDNHTIKRSQLIANCMQMANLYASMGGAYTASVDRSDT